MGLGNANQTPVKKLEILVSRVLDPNGRKTLNRLEKNRRETRRPGSLAHEEREGEKTTERMPGISAGGRCCYLLEHRKKAGPGDHPAEWGIKQGDVYELPNS